MRSAFSKVPRWGGVCLVIGLAVLMGPLALAAEVFQGPPIKEWQKTLDVMESRLSAADIKDEELQGLRETAQTLRDALGPARSMADAHAATVRKDLEALGPAPEAGQPPEAPGLRVKRQQLLDQVALAEASGKETELTRSRLDRVVETIKARRRDRFTEEVLTRVMSPLNPSLWVKASPDWLSLGSSGLAGLQAFFDGLGSVEMGLMLAVSLGLVFVRHRVGRLLSVPRHGSLLGTQDAGMYTALTATVLDVMLATSVIGVFFLEALLTDRTASTVSSQVTEPLGLLILTVLIHRFFQRILNPEAHLFDIDPRMARRLGTVVTALALLFVLEEGVNALIAGQNASLEVSITNHVVFSLFAATILVFLIRPLQSDLIRAMTVALIIAIVVSVLGGYVALGRLLATRGVLTLVLVVGIRVFFRIIDAISRVLLAPDTGLGASLRQRLDLSDEDTDILVFWLGILVKSALLVSCLLALLFLWSLDRKDLLIFIADSFQGFRVGSLTLSPSAILTGLCLFLVLLGLTRFLQRVLEDKVFPKTRLDSGIRHSVRSGFGYLGFGLSSMLAISVMGVDLSNLAMIAGALSVGIGFGLQNIVNNFVSGLILLIERPIKAGDWVVVGEHQGIVQKISVRATQITTFDRTSVYIPNSSLISGAVQNKTNPDRVGRVVLPLLMDQDQDLPGVQSRLIQMATDLPEVRHQPAPSVFVTGLSDTNIHVELVAFVHDVASVQKVTSQLYTAILAAFKSGDIRRKPQKPQEVHVRLSNSEAPEMSP